MVVGNVKKAMQMACNEHEDGVVVIYQKGGCPLCDAIYEWGQARERLAEAELRAGDVVREMRI